MRVSKQGAAMLRRLAKAASILRSGRMVQADGAWVITSETGHTYVVNGSCQCRDARHPKRNGGWCKHKLATWLATELAEGKQNFAGLYALAVRRIVNRHRIQQTEKHPAGAANADGAQGKIDTQQGSATDAIFQAQLEPLWDEVNALRAALEELLTRYEADLEARRAFAPH